MGAAKQERFDDGFGWRRSVMELALALPGPKAAVGFATEEFDLAREDLTELSRRVSRIDEALEITKSSFAVADDRTKVMLGRRAERLSGLLAGYEKLLAEIGRRMEAAKDSLGAV